ncbi:MAG: elongation factor Ts [Bacteroidetes bacterium]|nr:elongation factor Ts [Bacteroidota bacterium]
MTISAKEVKQLRDITGVGMMDCKRALVETEGDFEAAIDLLRKTGQKVAAKRADREAKEGIIATASSEDGRTAILVEVNCETDFVARNDEFQQFVSAMAIRVLRDQPTDRDAFLASEYEGGRSVQDGLTELTGKIGEKIDVRRLAILRSDAGNVVSYIHPGSRLGVLVDISGSGDLLTSGRDVAMQVAALNPIATRREDVPEIITSKEMEIAREAALNEGKPEHILDRIATGKLERYYRDNVLLEQPFVKDSSQTVTQMLKDAGAEVDSFVRFALGE